MTTEDQVVDVVRLHPGAEITAIAEELGLTYDYTAELLGRAKYRGRLRREKGPGDRRQKLI
jgi:DNA-binding MarR family transcriptional regulator